MDNKRIENYYSCTPVADSCQCMAKPIQYCKVKKKKRMEGSILPRLHCPGQPQPHLLQRKKEKKRKLLLLNVSEMRIFFKNFCGQSIQ